MNVAIMAALSLLDSDGDEAKKGGTSMTDLQFKAFARMCLVLTENAKDAKELRKLFGNVMHNHGSFSAFAQMLQAVAETKPAGDLESVKQILQDILKVQ